MKKFDVIVADPPWSFSDKLRMSEVKRGARANYSTMTISDIQQLPINSHCADDGAVLCLWVPSSLLQDGLDTMKAWGFTHKQTYVWVKTKKEPLGLLSKSLKDIVKEMTPFFNKAVRFAQGNQLTELILDTCENFASSSLLAFGMGRLFRQTHELCLVGTSSNQIYRKLQNKSQRSVCFGENLKHSAKPEALQDSLELMFPKAHKIELFARRVRSGWTCLGNEIDGKDIRDALAEL